MGTIKKLNPNGKVEAIQVWKPETIDLFLSVTKRREFVMNGAGTVRDPVPGDSMPARLYANCNRYGESMRVEVRDWSGRVLYIGIKD